MRRTLPSFAAVTLVCLLTACGGDTGTTATVPVEVADPARLLQQDGRAVLTGPPALGQR
ncbi:MULTISPECIES: hypothetical protein [unclassified Micromonospora]|uniref:hypothetical protein n=1 Tax=unclassified Micromonospora TaxID=2617518 RepID=UPI002FF1B2D0